MTLEELIKQVENLNKYIKVIHDKYDCVEIANVYNMPTVNSSGLLNDGVMMFFSDRQQDFNDIDEIYWKNFYDFGPRIVNKLLNLVLEYCDTPVDKRGLEDKEQEQYFKDNDCYVLVDNCYLLAKTQYECNIFALVNLIINNIDLIEKIDTRNVFTFNPFRLSDVEVDQYVREQPLFDEVKYKRFSSLEELLDYYNSLDLD